MQDREHADAIIGELFDQTAERRQAEKPKIELQDHNVDTGRVDFLIQLIKRVIPTLLPTAADMPFI